MKIEDRDPDDVSGWVTKSYYENAQNLFPSELFCFINEQMKYYFFYYIYTPINMLVYVHSFNYFPQLFKMLFLT